jgi:hypothetical protein
MSRMGRGRAPGAPKRCENGRGTVPAEAVGMLRRLLPLGCLLAVAACEKTEVDSMSGGIATGCGPDAGATVLPDAGPVDQGATADTTPAPAPDTAAAIGKKSFALTQEQLRNLGSGNREYHPDSLHIFLGNRERTCGNPFAAGEPYCGSWTVSFKLPPELQAPGTTVHVEDPRLNFFLGVGGTTPGPGGCSGGGGGSLLFGDVLVLERSTDFIVVKLVDTRSPEVDASGTYTVALCR